MWRLTEHLSPARSAFSGLHPFPPLSRRHKKGASQFIRLDLARLGASSSVLLAPPADKRFAFLGAGFRKRNRARCFPWHSTGYRGAIVGHCTQLNFRLTRRRGLPVSCLRLRSAQFRGPGAQSSQPGSPSRCRPLYYPAAPGTSIALPLCPAAFIKLS